MNVRSAVPIAKEVAQPSRRGGDVQLFVLEMGEQMPLEHLERICDGLAGVVALVLAQRSGGGFDGVEIVGHRAVFPAQVE